MKIRPKMKKRKVPSSTRKSVAKRRARDVCKQLSFFLFHFIPVQSKSSGCRHIPAVRCLCGWCCGRSDGTWTKRWGGTHQKKFEHFRLSLSPPCPVSRNQPTTKNIQQGTDGGSRCRLQGPHLLHRPQPVTSPQLSLTRLSTRTGRLIKAFKIDMGLEAWDLRTWAMGIVGTPQTFTQIVGSIWRWMRHREHSGSRVNVEFGVSVWVWVCAS